MQVGDLLALSALPPGKRHEPNLVEFLAQWSNGRKIHDTRLGVECEADDDHYDEDTESEDLDRDPADACATEPMAVSVRDSDAVQVLRADGDALAGSRVANGITLEASPMDGNTRE